MRRVLDNVVLRLVLYYAAILVLFTLVLRLFPWIADAVARERARGIHGAALDSGAFSTLSQSVPLTDAEALVPIALTLLGALALALPVAFVYQWTREPEPYRRDFGRALIALPIAVALAVFLVKNSLALAFSLAGIVAAIRWRAALRETMDGVFTFVVIGIGLAAGVQLLMVAFVASMVFNAMILVLAKTGYATEPRQLDGWHLTAPAAPTAATAAKTQRRIAIRVMTSDERRSALHLEAILASHARHWSASPPVPAPDGPVLLEYRATLRKRFTPDAVAAAIGNPGTAGIDGVEVVEDSPQTGNAGE